jgi:hypothetical protein
MHKTEALRAWMASQNDLFKKSSPDQQVEAAIARVKSVAFTAGLLSGLLRLEKIACLIPNRTITGPVVIKLARQELEAAIEKWKTDHELR